MPVWQSVPGLFRRKRIHATVAAEPYQESARGIDAPELPSLASL